VLANAAWHRAAACAKRVAAARPAALFMDCTHDNEVPSDLRAVLPLVGLPRHSDDGLCPWMNADLHMSSTLRASMI